MFGNYNNGIKLQGQYNFTGMFAVIQMYLYLF
jgi:hypothetical protein